MQKKTFILFTLFALFLWSVSAQEKLDFAGSDWDFGSIQESNGRVSHLFKGVNNGAKPIVILDVVTSCGCTAPEFTRQPILSGKETQIKVTYDPTNRPGAFVKELSVYSSDRRKIATLTIRGNVIPRQKTVEELYPIDAGNGLRLSESLSAFAYLYIGKSAQSAINYVNASKSPITLQLRPQTSSGLLKVNYPRQIAPSERGAINLSYLIPASAPRYGTLRDVFEVNVNNRSNGTLLMAHGIGVDAPVETSNPPKAEIPENMIKFGTVKQQASVQRQSFTVSNTGGNDLIIRAVENEGKVAVTLPVGAHIAPGKSLRGEVSFRPRSQDFGPLIDHIAVITNDPARPLRRVRVTAVIED